MDMDARNALIEEFYPIVRAMALKATRRLPSHVSVDDLISAGSLGLVEAASRYDPSKGSFKGFVSRRIHGAMIDELRSGDWIPRAERRAEREQNIQPLVQVPLDDAVWDTIIDTEPNALFRLLEQEAVRILHQLPIREQYIVAQWCHHNRLLKDIGETLGVSESRVSQLRTRALETMRRLIG